MSNPQIENGYTKIANEILEHLSYPGINGSEFRIILVVLRKTFGFHKKKDMIYLSQYQNATKMGRKQVVETIRDLVGKRILVKENNVYKFNKNWEEWVVGKRPPQCAIDHYPSGQKPTKSSGQKPTYKRNKETNTKEIVASDIPFSLKEEIKKLEDSPRRDLNIVALYFEHRKPDLQNRKQYEIALKRHLKPAGQLKEFTDNQILKALDYAKKEYKDIYTLETLLKILIK